MAVRKGFDTNLPVEISKGMIDQKRNIIPSEASKIFEADQQHVTEISMSRVFCLGCRAQCL